MTHSRGSKTETGAQGMIEASEPSLRLGWRARLAYGVGDFGLNFYWQGAGYFLLFYYTDVAGLPNTTAGIAYVLGGLVDAVTDPAMGVISDRTRTRWGRYRPYLLFGAIPLGLSFILLLTLPSLTPLQWTLTAALATHVLFRICYTAVSIPYSGLGARLTFDASERTTLSGVRMVCGALGGVVMVLIVSAFRNVAADSRAFFLSSLVAAGAGAVFIFLTFAGSREPRLTRASATDAGVADYGLDKLLPAIAANKPFLITVTAIFLLTVANMIVIKTVLYRFENVLDAPLAAGLAITLMTAAPLAAIPLWVWIYLKIDKKPAFLCGCAAVIAGLCALFAFGNSNVPLSIAAYTAIAAGFSCFAVGFWSILPDTIDYGHLTSGCRIESGIIGLASAIQKIGIALAGLGIGVVLDLIGYRGNSVQQPSTIIALHNFMTVAPVVFMAAAAFVFSRYPITSARHAQIVASISENRAGEHL
ncbi:MAG: glycoside-pentoside-hexuronide (GPH):cation symporter [Pseudomonadota bacterium]|nr:glycoside-pentoside-hexuronide (GPH):cation symporter [Pseudomonadota bacterium]